VLLNFQANFDRWWTRVTEQSSKDESRPCAYHFLEGAEGRFDMVDWRYEGPMVDCALYENEDGYIDWTEYNAFYG
jgi:hypothetical protein